MLKNTKPSVTSHGPHFVRSVLCDFGLSIFQYGQGNQLINRYYFRAEHFHLPLPLSFGLASYLCATNKLFLWAIFLCRPFNSLFVHHFWELFLCRTFNSPFFAALAGYFVQSIPWESFFCQPFNPPSFGKLFSCRPSNCPSVYPFGELFLCHPSIRRVIFMPTI